MSFLVYEAPSHDPHPTQSQTNNSTSSDLAVVKNLFLAGGISGCGNWHLDMIESLKKKCLKNDHVREKCCVKLYNPRRENFDVSDKSQSDVQIRWEHSYLHTVEAVSFWFCSETLCPITLYELGKISMMPSVKLFVGVHPDYLRRMDVETQTLLVRPEVTIVYSVEDLAQQVFDEYFAVQD
ncbi:predicted protein [Naegleria gruberi]|uniref:Predicted protein n=1 Tax=Naegleria gruberi TaxID=5762 RepID=D2V4M3_NAEGR|nr:uncharacterized protein NAEGRDRAFT_78578 [Naegleria gruberi]EFC47958.1 predicted protein [Naegleria gruberi]|eukprot:XP_002680702.1 predicted protein [Naegleria gruberi strain NEG-M]